MEHSMLARRGEKQWSPPTASRRSSGHTRREVLQVGYSTVAGIGLASLQEGLCARAAAGPGLTAQRADGRAKSVLLIFLPGGLSHVDTLDPKRDAPAEIRGAFQTIRTAVPGVHFCEHLPRIAARVHQLAVVRTMSATNLDHELGTHLMLTGSDSLPAGSNQRRSRSDWPSFASALDHLRPRRDGVANGVLLPYPLRGLGDFSGQYAGLLAARHDPWLVRINQQHPMAGVQEDDLPLGLRVEPDRLGNRRNLLSDIDRQRGALLGLAQQRKFTEFQHIAIGALTSGRLTCAMALDREPDRVHERYGHHLFGQSLLLARRMLQAGVAVVQVNLGDNPSGWWDTHLKNCQNLKERLLPPLDQAFAALLDDLQAHGLLDETLVVVTGEFGRTPKLGGFVGTPEFDPTGRDHWIAAFSAIFAGAGVRGGQVIGTTDRIGAFPLTRSYRPSDLGATVYSALGVHPESLIRDHQGRPLQLNHGSVIEPLYTTRGS